MKFLKNPFKKKPTNINNASQKLYHITEMVTSHMKKCEKIKSTNQKARIEFDLCQSFLN